MKKIVNWLSLSKIEDGCGGVIYKIIDKDNSELNQLEIVMCVFKPGEIAKLHYHKKLEEIYFIIEGSGEVELDGKWHKVQKEDCVSIPANVKHRMKNTHYKESLRFISVNSPEWQLSDMIIVE